MIHEQTEELILFLSPHRTSHFHKFPPVCIWVQTVVSLSQRARGGRGPLVVKDSWCEMARLCFFSLSLSAPHPFLPFQTLALVSPSTCLFSTCPFFTRLLLLHLYQTPLSYLTSLHPSICPSSSWCIFSHYPHYLPLFPCKSSSSSFSLIFFLAPFFRLSLIPLHPIFLFNPYSCNFYMAAWGCC